MSSWGGIDFFIFLILLLNSLIGMVRGLGKEIIAMICLSAALIFTIKFTIPLANYINSSPLITDVVSSSLAQNLMIALNMPALTSNIVFQVGYCISLLICFIGIFCVCEGVLNYTGFVESVSFKFAAINRKLSGSLGFVRGFVITLVFILVVKHLYLGQLGNSYFVRLFQSPAQKLDSLITQQAPERYKEILQDKAILNAKNILQDLN